MKVIIAGSRSGDVDADSVSRTIGNINEIEQLNITEVVSGGSSGVDKAGELWARNNNLPLKVFNANWSTYGAPAGPIRNRQMAEYADAVILFPGGIGTASMKREAQKVGIKIIEVGEI